jgi:hypothetical protein
MLKLTVTDIARPSLLRGFHLFSGEDEGAKYKLALCKLSADIDDRRNPALF